jgi:cytochrome P450
MGIASGNRDERVYERANEFWLGRWPGAPEHLTFGPGPHLCLGNQLARMEARVVLELVMELFPKARCSSRPAIGATTCRCSSSTDPSDSTW